MALSTGHPLGMGRPDVSIAPRAMAGEAVRAMTYWVQDKRWRAGRRFGDRRPAEKGLEAVRDRRRRPILLEMALQAGPDVAMGDSDREPVRTSIESTAVAGETILPPERTHRVRDHRWRALERARVRSVVMGPRCGPAAGERGGCRAGREQGDQRRLYRVVTRSTRQAHFLKSGCFEMGQ